MEERYELSLSRIKEIEKEEILTGKVRDFFCSEASFLLEVGKIYEMARDDELCKLDLESLRAINASLYRKRVYISNNYLSALSAEIWGCVQYAFSKDLYNLLIRFELFLEFYSAYVCAKEDKKEEAEDEELRGILYYYVNDYYQDRCRERLSGMLCFNKSSLVEFIENADWSDVRNLYLYGEYVKKETEDTLRYVAALPKETLKKMADTFTEGYRIGFEVTGKDLSKKKIAEIRFPIGFEPVIKLAIKNLRKLGLNPTIRFYPMNLIDGRGINRIGIYGPCPDKQFFFDHKDDNALIMDAGLNTVKLESQRKAYEELKDEASAFAGPLVLEEFGEAPFDYEFKSNAAKYDKQQQKQKTKFMTESSLLMKEYIKEEERSFTIIAFPTAEIGEKFPEIFDEVIKLNTLDYMLYRNVQQTIIDTLDKGEYVLIKGKGNNRTNLKINLCKLTDPQKQTKFENCVADVNIPVGEVFTSPVLEKSEGILNVGRVFLNGLEYKDLWIRLVDGRSTEYGCSNFESVEENEKYIKDNILFNHDFLPIGEFAIGTNTLAYTMGRRYEIEDKLPILIAEKTGPHFAFGDTCYSGTEDIAVFNPDGKEIIARDNEYSLQRNTDPSKAYFNCHTDITIPFDELGEISVVTKEDEVICIIEDGRFVLKGTEILNEAL